MIRRSQFLLGFLGATLALASVAWAGGPSDRHHDVLKKMLTSMENITKILGDVKDEESSQKAVDGLKKEAKTFIDLRKKAGELPPPSPEEKVKVAKEYMPKLEDTVRKLLNEIQRVQMLTPTRAILFELRDVFKAEKKK